MNNMGLIGEGGGVRCLYSLLTMINCTSSRNAAGPNGNGGGGIYNDASLLNIMNSILWNDFPNELLIENGAITIGFSDIEGDWAGEGNIEEDPLFVDPESGDFSLNVASPCIDAGDPYSRLDYDGTTNDMGATGGTGNLPDGVMGGPVFGTLSVQDSPFWVAEDLIIEDGTTLSIDPGVIIYLLNRSKILVYGELTARGTFDSLISVAQFRNNDKGGGINFMQGEGELYNCDIEHSYNYTGGGIYCYKSSPEIINCSLNQNAAISGGGLYIDYSSPRIQNCTVLENLSVLGGGGIYFNYSSPSVNNCTIVDNNALYFNEGDGIDCMYSSPQLINCILWDNGSIEIDADGGLPTVSYSDIETGWLGEGNISENPLFRDPENGDYRLQSLFNPDCGGPGNSPCIDTGDPSILDYYLGCEYGLGSDRSDMGAYGGENEGPSVSVNRPDNEEKIPETNEPFILAQNFPNPFNPSTTFTYAHAEKCLVSMQVFDLGGRKVTTLVKGFQDPGFHSFVWNGVNDTGNHVSSGVYIYSLTAGSITEKKKMVLLK